MKSFDNTYNSKEIYNKFKQFKSDKNKQSMDSGYHNNKQFVDLINH